MRPSSSATEVLHDEADRRRAARVLSGKPGAWQDEPWEGDVVAKVSDKIFAFLGAAAGSVGVKCGRNRDDADELIQAYPEDVSVMPYIGRSGWNTVRLGGAVPDDEVLELVDTSYELVVGKLPEVAAGRRRVDAARRPRFGRTPGPGRMGQLVEGSIPSRRRRHHGLGFVPCPVPPVLPQPGGMEETSGVPRSLRSGGSRARS